MVKGKVKYVKDKYSFQIPYNYEGGIERFFEKEKKDELYKETQ